ncbi:Bardet-Biedl syndrome 10 protein [Osmerus eperlanus]|uniref:Bardet-Biedl syndrome 10 protein n=1 Tax=Osmerus eperlanus TaxID=29151 RepID=UPI002E12BB9C
MLPAESLHLRHVLQTVSVLEAVILRSFGPDGGQLLFTRDSGQVMLTRHGTRILTALRLEHPLARMVVECVWKHSAATGDGSKTFILLLKALLRKIHTHTSQGPGAGAAAKRLAEELLAFGLDELADVIDVRVSPYCSGLSERKDATDTNTLQSLVGGFFHTRLGRGHCEIIQRLTSEMLSQCTCHDNLLVTSLRFIDAHFPALHTAISGFPIGSSRVIEGQVIHRDFSTPHPPGDHRPIKALMVTEPLEPEILNGGTVLELDRIGGGGTGVGGVFAWAQNRLKCVFGGLQSLGVTLLLSSVKQSDATLALARQAGMSVVECVPEDELSLFARLSGAEPVSDWSLIGRQNVAALTFCQPILLGAHRFVHVEYPRSTDEGNIQPPSLVVCGAEEGQTDQCVCALRDAFRMLLTTLEPIRGTGTSDRGRTLHTHRTRNTNKDTHTLREPPGEGVLVSGRVITVGGTFEWLLHHALLHAQSHTLSDTHTLFDAHTQSRTLSDSHTPTHTNIGSHAHSRILAEALLSVPRQIYSHSPHCYLQAQTQALRCLHDGGRTMDGSRTVKTELGPRETSSGSVFGCGLESVACKYRLILAVLQCVRSLLRTDAILHTHTPSHAHSHRHSNTPQQDSEEED